MQPSSEKTATIKEQLEREKNAWDHKPRYGLFSYNANHGIGFRDDNTKLNRRDETGKVITSPKNFVGGRPKSANVRLDAFTRTGYLSQSDEYIDPSKTLKLRNGDSNLINKVHNKAFKPSADVPKRLQAPYEFISEPIEATQIVHPPKNFVTTGMKKGYGNTTYGHLFSQPRYVTDPFDYAQEVDTKERFDHLGKIRNGPFSLTFPKRDHFTPSMRVYRDPPGTSGRRIEKYVPNGFRPFLRTNLPKKGYNCTINRFPQYVEQPPLDPAPRKPEGKWKVGPRELSVPTPSVQAYNALHRPKTRF